jgi:hypothetical protein
MSLVDSLLLDPVRVNYFVAVRTDNAKGTGSMHDPFNGATKYETAFPCTISFSGREATVSTGGTVHPYANGDSIKISGVTGTGKRFFNGTFVIYEVAATSFKYWMRGVPEEAAGGTITCARVIYLFDAVMAAMPANAAIHLGPRRIRNNGVCAEHNRRLDSENRAKDYRIGHRRNGASSG